MNPAPNMMMAAPPMPSGPMTAPASAAPTPSPQQVADFRVHIGAIVDGILALLSRPRGDLTRKDTFDAAAEMIAKGAFPTPEAKQDLIITLSKLPDDEPELRQALSATLLQVSTIRAQLHEMHGTGQPMTPAPMPEPMADEGGNV